MHFSKPQNYTLFKRRRAMLTELVKQQFAQVRDGIILLCGAFEPDRTVFRQESSFYYLTGITEPGVMLGIDLNEQEVLYVPQFSSVRQQWVTTTIDAERDATLLEVDSIKFLGSEQKGYSFVPIFTLEKYQNILATLKERMVPDTTLFVIRDEHQTGAVLQYQLLDFLIGQLGISYERVVNVAPVVHEMRKAKDEYEIDLLYKAAQLTSMAQESIAKAIQPGKFEYELQATIEFIFSHIAAAGPAFPSIVATGQNTTILHYTDRIHQLRENELVVVDIGAEYGYYAADITRTYPVDGVFSTRQKEVYNIVLETQRYVEGIAKPGMFLSNPEQQDKSLHHLAIKFLEGKGYAQYFCHGIGHYLGLDVHDVGSYKVPLEPGNVFTIEPGLYICEENIGVRIEDDYVMTDEGAVCLSYELTKEADEIERLMAR
ncbi:MAG: aminopeptidase P N-terminal domain-containing protein [Epsilonproteobacteria bacterium]|nr:aminopeptidase P N-terminal domain-containing protein [Campylobacterota bacterium]